MKRARLNPVCLLAVACRLAHPTVAGAATVTIPHPPLEAGREVSASLQRDQVHTYPFRLEAGQFARIVVTRLGADPHYRITSPTGQVLVDNRQTFFTGQYDSFVVAPQVAAAGNYVLSLHFLETTGTYRVKLQELRPATADDELRLKAQSIREAFDIPDHKAADAPLREALEFLRSVREERGALVTMLEIVRNSLRINRQRQDRALCEEAIELARKLGDRWAEAEASSALGVIYSDLNEKARAMDQLEKSLALATELNDTAGMTRTLSLLGSLSRLLRQESRALAYYSRSIPLARDLGIAAYLAGGLLGSGMALSSMGRRAEARAAFEEALALYRKLPERSNNEPAILLELAGLAETEKQMDQALTLMQEALAAARAIKDDAETGNALNQIARHYGVAGDWAKALPYLEEAVTLSRAHEVGLYHQSDLAGLARAHLELGNIPKALAYGRESLGILEKAVARSGGSEAQVTYFSGFRGSYSLLAAILRKAGNDAEAFEVSERSRARGLAGVLSAAGVDLRSGIPSELLNQAATLEKAVAAKLNALSGVQRRAHNQPEAGSLQQEIDELRHQQDRLLARIRAAHPNYASLTQFTGISAARVREELLDNDTVLVEYMLERNRNFVFAVTRQGVTGAPIASRTRVEAAARTAYESLTARNRSGPAGETAEQRGLRIEQADAGWAKASAELAELLLKPVAPALAGKKRWLVVSDEILHHVPFAALPPPTAGEPAAREVVNLPSAAVLSMIRQFAAGRKPAAKTVAIFADPVFDKGDPRLRSAGAQPAPPDAAASPLTLPRLLFTRREAEAILSLVPRERASLAESFAASRAAAQDPRLASYRILHFATHGILNEEAPALSGIALSLFDAAGRPQNGFLRLHDIYNLKLPVDLVVLSACQTALGKRMGGEGVIGLTRGVMYAGAARVVASLWKVDDAATAEFMRLFYQAILKSGQAPAAALFTAQRQMAAQRRWSSPYYWAAFQLHGEYR